MKFIHYTHEEFEIEPRDYDQSKLHWQSKPRGLWFSVEGPEDWKWWCEAENFCIENLKISYELKIKEKSKILWIETEKDIFEMTNKYPMRTRSYDIFSDTYQLNWKKVKEEYQGIVIPKYFWECRLALESCWYYGWDCASGCIWDVDCIEEFKLIEVK